MVLRSKEESSSLLRECQAILTVYLVTLCGGVGLGFSTVAISGIKEQANSTDPSIIPNIQSSEEDLSWFAGCMPIGTLLGSLPGGFLGARIGPKKTIMIASIPGIIGWVLIATAPHLANLIIGRIICGISSGFVLANSQALVAQYSSRERRGVFLSIFSLNEVLGITLTYSMAIFLSWRLVAVIPCVLYLVSLAGLWIVPESPIWLLGNKGRDAAEVSLKWLRGRKDIENELLELEMLKEKQNKKVGFKVALKNLPRPDIYKPFLLVLSVFLFCILMGRFIVVFYAVQIFEKAGMHGNQLLPAVVSGALQVVGVVLGIFLIQRLKRRTLASIALSICTLSMAVLGASLYLKSLHMETSVTQILPVICVSIYLFAYSFGIGPISMVYIGELMPPEYNVLTGLVFMTATFFMFASVTLFPVMMKLIQPYGTYWLFSGVCLVFNIFILFVMPETKGMSMLQIRQLFIKNSLDHSEEATNDVLTLKTNNISSRTHMLKS